MSQAATNNSELDRVGAALRAQPDLVLAFAFGSVASDQAGPESDIDIAVLAEKPGLRRSSHQVECPSRSSRTSS